MRNVKYFVAGFIFAVGLLGFGLAIGQTLNVPLLGKSVISINQQIPVIADLVVPLDDGDMLTTTVPFTVGVDFAVSISGMTVDRIKVEEEVVPQPTVEVFDANSIPGIVGIDAHGVPSDSNELILPNEGSKNIPHNILDYINVSSPIEQAKEILGNPYRVFPSSFSLFTYDTIDATSMLYRFNNFDIAVESEDDISISNVVIQRGQSSGEVNIPPFQDTSIGKITLGESTIGDLARACDYNKAKYFRSSKDAYFAMECYFGNLGYYRYYTFGCYCFRTDAKEFINGELISHDGEVLDLQSQTIDFIAISNKTNRGHHINYRDFR